MEQKCQSGEKKLGVEREEDEGKKSLYGFLAKKINLVVHLRTTYGKRIAIICIVIGPPRSVETRWIRDQRPREY